jgi:hypothetical protein
MSVFTDNTGKTVSSQGPTAPTGTPVTIYDTYGGKTSGTMNGGTAVPDRKG